MTERCQQVNRFCSSSSFACIISEEFNANFFFAYCTIELQLLDLVMIYSLIRKCRIVITQKAKAAIDRNQDFNISILQTMYLLYAAWKDVALQTVIYCLEKLVPLPWLHLEKDISTKYQYVMKTGVSQCKTRAYLSKIMWNCQYCKNGNIINSNLQRILRKRKKKIMTKKHLLLHHLLLKLFPVWIL